ncbi:fasciclin domain-containing protein [Nocardioides sp. zg-1228]|uniref:fasciclin domain-containing protein n=1 Tax=Nocardioides sp. zg-1228 TaxID=2763008 RepID=UPI001642F388|nr:fasciclin domain-containing protein [Nocardioides sp. zg-1228]MBC2933101.1 fasciclin domain-containing protein [Nocardioides sp. zg-1228]QSF56712.1 fasciclin domain-containing protein [Nocardioides sp. zg-1228]
MNVFRRTTATLALALTTALVAPAAAHAAGSGSGGAGATGTNSLASVLTADGNQFDRDWYDYDIVTEAVLAVIAADSDANSPVRLLADGSVALTAFLPNDRAFQVLVKDLTGRWVRSEADVFAAVASLGIDTVENVLLYHVVPGATITARDALRSNGAQLTTALGPTIGVKVPSRFLPIIILRDQDPNDVDPIVNPLALDINRGNAQIAHGITFVLRPADL